jgi:hypothetical protein
MSPALIASLAVSGDRLLGGGPQTQMSFNHRGISFHRGDKAIARNSRGRHRIAQHNARQGNQVTRLVPDLRANN